MRHLSGKEKKNLKILLPKGYDIDKKDEIIIRDEILLRNNEPYLIVKNNKYIPHLKSLNDEYYKSVYVDKGAIPHLLNGADMMRPGIQKIDDNIEKEDLILIRDENHNKILAVGESLYTSEELKCQEKGKSVKVLHYVSDEYY